MSAALIISGSGEPGQRARLHENAFQAAANARVEHVVYLSLQGAGPDSKYPFSRDHYLSEQYLLATGLPHTVLRNSFYIDMFLEKFDEDGTIRGPAGHGCGAFVSREDVSRTAAAVLRERPRGIYDVTGPEVLSVSEVASRFSILAGRRFRYEEESPAAARARVSLVDPAPARVDLSVGWFEAIAAGELDHVSDTVRRFTGAEPLTLERYFRAFPNFLRQLQN